MAAYKANRAVIRVERASAGQGMIPVARFAVPERLEDAQANVLSPDLDDRELAAIEYKLGEYLLARLDGLTAHCEATSLGRPSVEVTLANCIPVVMQALYRQREL